MLWRKPGSYDFEATNGRVRSGSPFWKYLNAAGLRVGLVNVPYTHPPDPLEGFVVAGFGAGKSARVLTYPPEELNRIEVAFGPYQPTVETAILRRGTPDEILAAERQHQTLLVDIACDAAARHAVDVLVINLMLLDHANHKMPTMSGVEQAIEYCDRDLARLLHSFRPDHVILLSDHGSRRLKGRFLLHAWLCDRGYQVQTQRSLAEQTQALNWLLVKWLDHRNGKPGADRRALRALLRNSVPRFPAPLMAPFWELLERSIPYARDYVQFAEPVDYRRTSFFPGSIYSGLLYVNLAGRDPQGLVPVEEHRAVIDGLREALAGVSDPDADGPLFAHIHLAEEIYQGPALAAAPDVILDSYGGDWNIQTVRFTPALEASRHRYFVGNQREHGWHSSEGICVFRGPRFRANASLPLGHVMDIAPTLLHLYGIPVPDDYDGHVLTEALIPDSTHPRPVTYQRGDGEPRPRVDADYSPEEAEEIAEHLRGLGYIE